MGRIKHNLKCTSFLLKVLPVIHLLLKGLDCQDNCSSMDPVSSSFSQSFTESTVQDISATIIISTSADNTESTNSYSVGLETSSSVNLQSISGIESKPTSTLVPTKPTITLTLVLIIIIAVLISCTCMTLCIYWYLLYKRLNKSSQKRTYSKFRKSLPCCCRVLMPPADDVPSSVTASPLMTAKSKGRLYHTPDDYDFSSEHVKSEGAKAIGGDGHKFRDYFNPFGASVEFDSVYEVHQITQKDDNRGGLSEIELPIPTEIPPLKPKPPHNIPQASLTAPQILIPADDPIESVKIMGKEEPTQPPPLPVDEADWEDAQSSTSMSLSSRKVKK